MLSVNAVNGHLAEEQTIGAQDLEVYLELISNFQQICGSSYWVRVLQRH